MMAQNGVIGLPQVRCGFGPTAAQQCVIDNNLDLLGLANVGASISEET